LGGVLKPKIVLTDVTDVTDTDPEDDGSLVFEVGGTVDGIGFAFRIGISPKEGGSWDCGGDVPEEAGPDIIGEVFDHPVVKEAIRRALV
jgi:hypothetical protein